MFWLASSNAAAQASYKVTDLGAQGNDNLGCSCPSIMRLDANHGREPGTGQQANFFGRPLNGRAWIDIDGFMLDLGTLAGPNS